MAVISNRRDFRYGSGPSARPRLGPGPSGMPVPPRRNAPGQLLQHLPEASLRILRRQGKGTPERGGDRGMCFGSRLIVRIGREQDVLQGHVGSLSCCTHLARRADNGTALRESRPGDPDCRGRFHLAARLKNERAAGWTGQAAPRVHTLSRSRTRDGGERFNERSLFAALCPRCSLAPGPRTPVRRMPPCR